MPQDLFHYVSLAKITVPDRLSDFPKSRRLGNGESSLSDDLPDPDTVAGLVPRPADCGELKGSLRGTKDLAMIERVVTHPDFEFDPVSERKPAESPIATDTRGEECLKVTGQRQPTTGKCRLPVIYRSLAVGRCDLLGESGNDHAVCKLLCVTVHQWLSLILSEYVLFSEASHQYHRVHRVGLLNLYSYLFSPRAGHDW